jgi:hypothetical protein
MRKMIFAGTLLALVGCTATGGVAPLNPNLARDGNLVVAALQVLSTDATTLGAPAEDVTVINVAIDAVQTELTALQKGSMTPQDVATNINAEIGVVAPPLLRDFKANATIKTGVLLLQNFVTIIAADVAPVTTAPTAAAIDTRSKLDAWVHGQKK